jgi:hypothetical protein
MCTSLEAVREKSHHRRACQRLHYTKQDQPGLASKDINGPADAIDPSHATTHTITPTARIMFHAAVRGRAEHHQGVGHPGPPHRGAFSLRMRDLMATGRADHDGKADGGAQHGRRQRALGHIAQEAGRGLMASKAVRLRRVSLQAVHWNPSTVV